jgi:glycosyltransferase involved in cell wall biosynthesis
MSVPDPNTPAPSAQPEPPSQSNGAAGLRVAFFSDSLPERNGTGAYYHDLISQLAPRVEAVEIFQPKPRKGRPLLSLPMPGDPLQRLVAPNIWRISKGFRQLRPNIVVSITPGPFGLLGLYHAKRHGACFISAFHTDFEKLAQLYWRPVNRAIANGFLRNANRLLCRNSRTVLINNSDLRKDVTALGAPSVEVMGTPLQPSFLDRPIKAPPGAVKQICFAGRLAAEKNVDQIIAAARDFPELDFVIGGDGPLRKSLEASAADLPNVRFTGWLSREALVELLDASSLLLLPSKLETFGSVALEAMARGRPALVAANAGIHDWPQLEAGLFKLEPGTALTDALRGLCQLPAEAWQNKAVAARQAAEQLNDETITQWTEVLARCLREK